MSSRTSWPETTFRLRDADSPLRLFLTAFLVIMTAGYLVGLLFVEHKTAALPHGIAAEYRGMPEAEQAAEFKYPMSADEMYLLLHNHILSLAIVFFAVGGIFYFSSVVSNQLKTWLIVEPLAALGTTFGGIWLTRFVAEEFSWLVLVSGIATAVCYFLMVTLILKELWIRQ